MLFLVFEKNIAVLSIVYIDLAIIHFDVTNKPRGSKFHSIFYFVLLYLTLLDMTGKQLKCLKPNQAENTQSYIC